MKILNKSFPRNTPFSTKQLAKAEISSFLASHYVKRGWFLRLGKGVFCYSGAELKAEPTIQFLAEAVPDIHVGGITALGLHGFRHNLRAKEFYHLYGKKYFKLPKWFAERFPASYKSQNLFDDALPASYGIEKLPFVSDSPNVSVPERALLEMLNEIGVSQEIEEAKNVMEFVRSPRIEILKTLLQHCRKVKVVRSCVSWANELNLPWAAEIQKAVKDTGKGRFVLTDENGKHIILKPYE